MTQPRSRVDLYAAIRRDARFGMSNALQRKHGVGFPNRDSGAGICMAEGEKVTAQRASRLDALSGDRRLAALDPRRAAEAATRGEADLRSTA